MHVLLTNDDGIYADGIHALRKKFEGICKVTVVAPDRERSATGHAITVHHPLRVEKVTFKDSDVDGWAVSGTPSDCVKIALEALLIDHQPDLIISGINRGANLGTDILYSGTVSAAVEGAILGVPSFAVSLCAFDNPNYDYAARVAKNIALKFCEIVLPPNTLLNVNIPSLDEESIAGVKVTKLGVRKYKNVFDLRRDPWGRVYYWLAGEVLETEENDEDPDVIAIRNNLISITPIHFDLTNYTIMHQLREQLNLEEFR